MPSTPLLVFGPRSLEYDFGPSHPLSPRRFGPGIALLKAVGAEPGLAPQPASDDQLEWLHSAGYVAAVKRFSQDPRSTPVAGIGPGDDPPFAGMHEAAAAVAGGSIEAMEAILRGDTEHAYQPGGGLHHAMRERASGFCIYNDPALAIARARQVGLRVLYIDLDVHHGDGVQALHYADPAVLTVSFHETGMALFPGTGFVDELGEGRASGTSVNIPLEPKCGPEPWLAAVRTLVPELAAAFGPDIVVSQHGADGHVWDPLAHLCLTTTAMGEAARLVDRIAHRYAGGRWLATGGGGYAIYRVVPRVWAMTWLAGAHREVPGSLPPQWLEEWSGGAPLREDGPIPDTFEDGASVLDYGAISKAAGLRAEATVELVRTLTVPALVRVASQRGWWAADEPGVGETAAAGASEPTKGGRAEILAPLTLDNLQGIRLAPRTVAPAYARDGLALLRAAVGDGAVAAGAVSGEWLVGVALAAPGAEEPLMELAALGVAPGWRRQGIARALLRALVADSDRGARALTALHTVGERDPFLPLPREMRRSVAERLFAAPLWRTVPAPSSVAAADPSSFLAIHLPPSASSSLAELVRKRFGAA
jgi:acetoin utilization protein AcuC